MATYTKIPFNEGPASNAPITLDPYGSDTNIHTMSGTTGKLYEIWLWAISTGSTAQISLRTWDPVMSVAKDFGVIDMQANAVTLILPGIIIEETSPPITLQAADVSGSGSTNVTVFGYVNRITP
jgi:hypothetical protein